MIVDLYHKVYTYSLDKSSQYLLQVETDKFVLSTFAQFDKQLIYCK